VAQVNAFGPALLAKLLHKGTVMNNLSIIAISAAFAFAFSSGAMAAQGMTKVEYQSAKDKIAANYKSAKARCDSLTANTKDVCMAEAKGKENVAMAELEAHSNPSEKARHDVNIAKAEAAYAVAKEKCDVKTGNDKTACVKEAQAREARAKANAGKPAPEKSAAASPKKDSAEVYIDDSVITAKVKAAVLDEPSLKSAEINVETSKGRVQLSGFVRSRADINKAVEVTKRVEGVKLVKNDMILKGTQ